MSSQVNKHRILVLESNDAMAADFQKRLQEVGYDVRTTWSGHEALALTKSDEFDVLLMDNYIPDLHATDFLARLSGQPVQPWVVVMKGGSPESGSIRRYRSLGASSVVNKRDPEQVMQAVSACCAKEPLAKVTVGQFASGDSDPRPDGA